MEYTVGYGFFGHKKRGSEKIPKPLICLVAGATRLELATSGVTGRRSNQLNYTPEKVFQIKKRSLGSRVPGSSPGRRNRARTCDLRLVRPPLSQLSYPPVFRQDLLTNSCIGQCQVKNVRFDSRRKEFINCRPGFLPAPVERFPCACIPGCKGPFRRVG
jgi:hypothetical protein